MKIKIILGILFILFTYQYLSNRHTQQPNGILVFSEPIQEEIDIIKKEVKDFTLFQIATYSIEARVLAKRNYILGKQSELSPLDLALGWKEMSSNELLDNIEVTQGNRFYFVKFKNKDLLIKKEIMIASSANVHLIPANNNIKKKLNSIHIGDIIKIQGYLVNVRDALGFLWRTSLSRTDIGNGACEIIFVEDVIINER